jgi:Glycosyltransferase family 87
VSDAPKAATILSPGSALVRVLFSKLSPAVLLAGTVAIALILGWLMLEQTNLTEGVPSNGDSIADWLVTKAFVAGEDPYLPVSDLGEVLGVPWESANSEANPVHPRLPGAFLVQLPMVLGDAVTASWAVVVAGYLGILFSLNLLARRLTAPFAAALLYLAVALVSGPALWGFAFVSQAVLLVGILGIVAWHPSEAAHAWVRGIAIGIAGTLRLFPLLLLFAYARRRDWKTIAWSVGTFMSLNVIAVLVGNIALDRVIDAFAASLDTWFRVFSNISLLAWLDRAVGLPNAALLPLQVALVGVGLLIIWRRRPNIESELGALIVLGVAGISVSWPQYVLAILPFLLVVAIQRESSWLWRGLAVLCLIPFFGLLPDPWWAASLIGLFALFVSHRPHGAVSENSTRPKRSSTPVEMHS